MPIERIFLGWDGPALERVCDFLFDWIRARTRLQGGIDADFSEVIIVTPGGRSGRLLLGLMLDRAEALGLALSPPAFVTPGEMPGIVLGTMNRVASPIQCRLAWTRAISACEADELTALLPRKPEEARGFSSVAALLERAHEALIGEGIRFEEVAARADLGEREAARWRAAAAVQQRYEQELASIKLVDDGLVRLAALNAGAVVVARRIVLVGVAELGGIARRTLKLNGIDVASLIAAPQSVADTLDEFGCVVDSKWVERRVDVRDDAIVFANGPEDQAYRAMEVVAAMNGRYAPHEIAVAVPDEDVIPKLERASLRYAGIPARPAAGVSIMRSPVVQLLSAIRRFREEGSFESFASLVRHPDMEKYLLGAMSLGPRERWLALLDEYSRSAVPERVTDVPFRMEDDGQRRLLESVVAAVQRLLAPLDQSGGCAQALVAVMSRVYTGQRVGRDDRSMQETVRACEMVRDAIFECASMPNAWLPRTSEAFIGLLLDVLGSKRITIDSSVDSIELLGWLELPLDPSPAAIVTGVNDGTLPESFRADPFLPDGLRERLGIACSRSRMARDAFLMSMVARSRPEVTLICARIGATGEPLLPSRLLFAADDSVVVDRVRRFVTNPDARAFKIVPHLAAGGEDQFPIRPVVPNGPITSMRVTAFRIFLASPYLFYLQVVRGACEFELLQPELDRMQFGILVHDVLRAWGESDRKDSTDVRAVRSVLRDYLGTFARERFGANPAVAVALQLAIAAARLDEFARWQVGHREQGWCVDQVEWKPEGGMARLPGLPFEFHISGKIDRIDRHDDGRVSIIDYKTSDGGEPPWISHGGKGKWKDLQLPLYRHLAATMELPSDPSRVLLAYVTLPRKARDVHYFPAKWTVDDLQDADRKAMEVAKRVYEGDFQDLGPRPPTKGVFAALCGTAFMESLVDDAEGEL